MRLFHICFIFLTLVMSNKAFANHLYGIRIFSDMVYIKSENELVGTQVLLIPYAGGLKILLQFAAGPLMSPELTDCKEGDLNRNGGGYCEFFIENHLWKFVINKNKGVLTHPNANQDMLTEIFQR